MKLLLDTNVLLASFVSRGVCAEFFEHVVRKHSPVCSTYILGELLRNLIEKLEFSRKDAESVVRLIESRFELVQPVELGNRVSRDPDDDPVLGTGLAGHCECLITGDRDLLVLKKFRGVCIITPAQFWRFEAEHPG